MSQLDINLYLWGVPVEESVQNIWLFWIMILLYYQSAKGNFGNTKLFQKDIQRAALSQRESDAAVNLKVTLPSPLG